jgi:uncharacterized protein YktB (UPF0637 family)
VEFTGFKSDDFDVFSIPDFPGRMGAIRERVRPRLAALGEDLGPRLEKLLELPTFPHVAQHMRRRVNPPQETWVAFVRDRKGYKRWTHYRVAVSAAGVRVTVFVEDDADDKPPFGASLAAAPEAILTAMGSGAPVLWYTLGEEPVRHADLAAGTLAELGERLQRLKTLKFQAGVPLPREEAVRMTPLRFEEWALEQMALLRPLYLAGAGKG